MSSRRPRWPRTFITAWDRWILTDPPCASVLAGDEDAPDYHIGVLVQRAATAIYAAGVTARNGHPATERHAAACTALAELEHAVAQMPDAMPVVTQWCAQSRDILDHMPLGGHGDCRSGE